LRAYNAAKCDCGRSSAGEAYSAPPNLLAGFKGPLRGGEGKRKGGKGKKGEGKRKGRREGKRRERRLTLMSSWNRAADWLRPALSERAK